jgi:hypothetical protein
MEPDLWQQKVLRSTAPRQHLNCSRQVGKSTVTAILALHRALYVPESVVLIVSPTDRQSGELYLKIAGFYRALGKPVDAAQENMRSLVLENGSRILSLPASDSGIRGFTAALVVIDEAAFVPDALYQAISPMVAVSGGRLVAMSTPAGRRGWWYEASSGPGWERVRIPARECPRIPAAFLEEERERLGPSVYAAEYECAFVDATGAAFDGDDIDAAFAAGRPSASHDDRGPTDAPTPSRDALEVYRHARSVEDGRGAVDRRRRAEQARCEHRWRVQSSGRVCVFCNKEEAA